jgi:hypothetical protein
MTTTHLTHRQEPAEHCDFIGCLLLTGIEYTDARPYIGFVGAIVTGLIFAVIKWRFM